MKIDFIWESFEDEDNWWDALFVKVGNGDWHLAQPYYGTENKEEIIRMVRINQLIHLLMYFTSASMVTLLILSILLNRN